MHSALYRPGPDVKARHHNVAVLERREKLYPRVKTALCFRIELADWPRCQNEQVLTLDRRKSSRNRADDNETAVFRRLDPGRELSPLKTPTRSRSDQRDNAVPVMRRRTKNKVPVTHRIWHCDVTDVMMCCQTCNSLAFHIAPPLSWSVPPVT